MLIEQQPLAGPCRTVKPHGVIEARAIDVRQFLAQAVWQHRLVDERDIRKTYCLPKIRGMNLAAFSTLVFLLFQSSLCEYWVGRREL